MLFIVITLKYHPSYFESPRLILLHKETEDLKLETMKFLNIPLELVLEITDRL